MKKQQKCMQEDATRTSLVIRKGKIEGKRKGNKLKEEEIQKISEERVDWDVQSYNDSGQPLWEGIDDQWGEFAFSWNIDVVDEQMPYWCTSWCPLWDMESITDLDNDVLWEDDIWDLKAIKHVPTP